MHQEVTLSYLLELLCDSIGLICKYYAKKQCLQYIMCLPLRICSVSCTSYVQVAQKSSSLTSLHRKDFYQSCTEDFYQWISDTISRHRCLSIFQPGSEEFLEQCTNQTMSNLCLNQMQPSGSEGLFFSFGGLFLL